MNAPKTNIVLVDDEERIVRSLAMLLRPHHNVFATTDAHQALDYVRRSRVHAIVSDQRMPLMRGADLLREVRAASPSTMRILLTGYSELDAIVASVNEGEVFRFINKPWDASELKACVQQATGIATGLFAEADAAGAPPVVAPAAPALAPAVLVIDDDAEVLKVVQELAGAAQPVLSSTTLDGAFDLLQRYDIGVIISELVVGQESIATALKLLKAQHPEVVTIVMTPFQDTGTLIDLINQGQVFRFLPKPVRRTSLSLSIAAAAKHHLALRASPIRVKAHAVERTRLSEEGGVTSRVLGFLARLRGRSPAARPANG